MLPYYNISRNGFYELKILWVGIGFAEETILLSVFLYNYHPNLIVKIIGIDVDAKIKKTVEKKLKDLKLSSRIKYICKSILDVDMNFINDHQFDCVYTSAAFNASVSLYMLFLSVLCKVPLLCNKGIIENITTVHSSFEKFERYSDDWDLQFPKTAGHGVWTQIAKANLNSENKESRDIFVISPLQLLGDSTVESKCKAIGYHALFLFQEEALALKTGHWAENIKRNFNAHKAKNLSGEPMEVSFPSSNAFESYVGKKKLIINEDVIDSSPNEYVFIDNVIESAIEQYGPLLKKKYWDNLTNDLTNDTENDMEDNGCGGSDGDESNADSIEHNDMEKDTNDGVGGEGEGAGGAENKDAKLSSAMLYAGDLQPSAVPASGDASGDADTQERLLRRKGSKQDGPDDGVGGEGGGAGGAEEEETKLSSAMLYAGDLQPSAVPASGDADIHAADTQERLLRNPFLLSAKKTNKRSREISFIEYSSSQEDPDVLCYSQDELSESEDEISSLGALI